MKLIATRSRNNCIHPGRWDERRNAVNKDLAARHIPAIFTHIHWPEANLFSHVECSNRQILHLSKNVRRLI